MDNFNNTHMNTDFKRSIATIFGYFKEDRRTYLIVISLTIIIGLMEFIGISSLMLAISLMIGEENTAIPYIVKHYIQLLNPLFVGLIYALLVLFQAGINLFSDAYFLKRMSFWRTDYSIEYVKNIINAGLPRFNKIRSGEIEVMITRNLGIAMKNRFMTANFISDCVLAVCYILIGIYISPFTFFLFSTLGLTFIILQKQTLHLRVKYSVIARDKYINAARKIIEYFADIRTLLINNKNYFLALLRNDLEKAALMQKRTDYLNVFFRNIHQPIMLFFFMVAVFISLVYLKQPKSTLLVISYVFYRAAPKIISVSRGYGEIIGDSPIDINPEIVKWKQFSPQEIEAEPPEDRSVVFKNVDLRYDEKHPLLTNVDLDVNPGDFVCITGKNGTGKSTILDVICGFHTVAGGVVKLGKVYYQDLNWFVWREKLGIVRPEGIVISGSWVDNIAFLEEKPDYQKIEEVLREVELLDYVKRVPQFINSNIEVRGANLSAGQRQRILLARALYRKPDLLLLDEPTSNLDTETEIVINKLLFNLKRKITIMVITHKKSILEYADRIYRTGVDGTVRLIS